MQSKIVKPAEQILEDLIAGNKRFLQGTTQARAWRATEDWSKKAPKAIILGCSDSRVPIEIIFDQSAGDLFVIRVAGNIVAPSQIGSVEFAAEQFKVPLVIVLGHTHCGAIEATMTALEHNNTPASDNLKSIVDRIAPAIIDIYDAQDGQVNAELAFRCMRSNVRASVNQLRHGSVLLETMTASGQLTIRGAHYNIESGTVSFLDLLTA